jgi:hypothetical protein
MPRASRCVHAPATPDTHHFLNAMTLALPPRRAIDTQDGHQSASNGHLAWSAPRLHAAPRGTELPATVRSSDIIAYVRGRAETCFPPRNRHELQGEVERSPV